MVRHAVFASNGFVMLERQAYEAHIVGIEIVISSTIALSSD